MEEDHKEDNTPTITEETEIETEDKEEMMDKEEMNPETMLQEPNTEEIAKKTSLSTSETYLTKPMNKL